MLAARQRAGLIARRIPRSTRNYASGAHHHHKDHEVTESFGVIHPSCPCPRPSTLGRHKAGEGSVADARDTYMLTLCSYPLVWLPVHHRDILQRRPHLPIRPPGRPAVLPHQLDHQPELQARALGGDQRRPHPRRPTGRLRPQPVRECRRQQLAGRHGGLP